MPGRQLEVRRGGVRLQVLDDGPLTGPAVLCLHGFPQDGTAFDLVRRVLTARGVRVLAPHQRGYSPDARPSGRSAYVLAELVDDALAVLDEARLSSAHVLGHDWGGVVGWALASGHPDRVTGLTVLSTPHPRAMVAAAARGQALRSSYVGVFQVPVVLEAVALAAGGALMRATLIRSGLPAQAAERYVGRLRQPGALRSALAWYRALPLRPRMAVGVVRVPTTYIWGTRDPFFARAAVRGTSEWVSAPFASIGLDAGHWLPEREPRQVAKAVLQAVRPSTRAVLHRSAQDVPASIGHIS